MAFVPNIDKYKTKAGGLWDYARQSRSLTNANEKPNTRDMTIADVEKIIEKYRTRYRNAHTPKDKKLVAIEVRPFLTLLKMKQSQSREEQLA